LTFQVAIFIEHSVGAAGATRRSGSPRALSHPHVDVLERDVEDLKGRVRKIEEKVGH
jgi:hypothetical protein